MHHVPSASELALERKCAEGLHSAAAAAVAHAVAEIGALKSATATESGAVRCGAGMQMQRRPKEREALIGVLGPPREGLSTTAEVSRSSRRRGEDAPKTAN